LYIKYASFQDIGLCVGVFVLWLYIGVLAFWIIISCILSIADQF
jgi:hypothetical protein